MSSSAAWREGFEPGEGIPAIVGNVHAMTVRGQHLCQHIGSAFVVIDDEDVRTRLAGLRQAHVLHARLGDDDRARR